LQLANLMKKALIPLIVFLFGSLILVGLYSAEKAELETFEGKLKKMGGEWFIISEGDFFQLDLAPEEYLTEHNVFLTSKEHFKADGLVVDEVINVHRILLGETIIELRDASGNPLWRKEKQVGHYKVNPKKCIGCQLCVHVCPTNAISMIHGKAVIDADKCIDCGLCEIGNGDYIGCPTKAIKYQE